MSITPKRPYFIRALHEWLEDNQFTAYLMVDSTHSDLVAPIEYAQDGRLVLNISYQATHNLHIDNQAIGFSARFGGVSQDVWVPMSAVLGIYAKEDTTHALFFDPSEYDDYDLELHTHTPTKDAAPPSSPKRPTLTFVD